MKQRAALVAYEQANGRYDVHRSAYIGQQLELAERISSETPYGHGDTDYEPSLVEDEVIETDLTLQQVVDRLDFSRFGAVVVVSETFEITPYRAPRFSLGRHCERVGESDPFGAGALVSLHFIDGDPLEDEAFCAAYRGAKQTLGRLVDAGVVTARDARERLRAHVAGYEDEGRDVRFATGQEPDVEPSSLAELAATGRRLLGQR